MGTANIDPGGENTTNVSVGGGLADPTEGTFTAGRIFDYANTTNTIIVDGHGGGGSLLRLNLPCRQQPTRLMEPTTVFD